MKIFKKKSTSKPSNKSSKDKVPLLNGSDNSNQNEAPKKEKKLFQKLLPPPQIEPRSIETKEIDVALNLYMDALAKTDAEPFEFLCANVVLRLALEKKLGNDQKAANPNKEPVVTQEDMVVFLNSLKDGALTLKLTPEQEKKIGLIQLQARDFGKRDSISFNDLVGTSNAFLSEMIGKFSEKIGLSQTQEEFTEEDEQHENNPELWRKYRVYIYDFQRRLQKETNYITAHINAVTTANKFFDFYNLFRQVMPELDAVYKAEANIHIGIQKDDAALQPPTTPKNKKIIPYNDDDVAAYISARRDEKLSLENALIYVEALKKGIEFPTLYALFLGLGKNHEESVKQAILLGSRNVKTAGFESYIRNMAYYTETYSLAYAVAFENKYNSPELYAKLIERNKSEIYAKAYVNVYLGIQAYLRTYISSQYTLTKQTEKFAHYYAEKVNAGKSELFAKTFLDALLGNFEMGAAEIYAETIDRTNSTERAKFNTAPTFNKWFNLHQARNNAISCTGIGFFILLCIGNAKVHAQKNEIAQRKAKYQSAEAELRRLPTEPITTTEETQENTTTATTPTTIEVRTPSQTSSQTYDEKCEQSKERQKQNEENWQEWRETPPLSPSPAIISDNNNNNNNSSSVSLTKSS